MKDCIKSRM